MEFSGVNYIAILVSAVAAMAIGAAWYSTLAKQWVAAVGFSQEQIDEVENGGNPIIYVFAALSHLVMAYFLAGVIGHLGQVTISGGLTTAFFLWLGFVVTTMIVNHRFQMKPWSLTIIDAGHYLAVLLVQGAIIGWFGV
ncbi:MAG: DUF1761 domain-containing protein [Pseudomonadota bacterium]